MNLQIMPHTKPGSSNPQMALPTELGFEIEKVVRAWVYSVVGWRVFLTPQAYCNKSGDRE